MIVIVILDTLSIANTGIQMNLTSQNELYSKKKLVLFILVLFLTLLLLT